MENVSLSIHLSPKEAEAILQCMSPNGGTLDGNFKIKADSKKLKKV